MKNLKLLLLLSLALFIVPGCYIDLDDDDDYFGCTRGNGDVETFTLDLDDFHSIRLTTSANVYLTQGNRQSVEVEADENLIDLLDTDVSGGEWDIEFDDCIVSYERFDIFITLPEIRSITSTGSGNIRGENDFLVDDIELKITGSGDIDVALQADDLEARISGSGDMDIEGECDDMELKISGSGDYNAFSLDALTADITISGSGDAEVYVEDYMDVRITGSGDVYFKGNPDIDVDITGSGDVIDRN